MFFYFLLQLLSLQHDALGFQRRVAHNKRRGGFTFVGPCLDICLAQLVMTVNNLMYIISPLPTPHPSLSIYGVSSISQGLDDLFFVSV